MAYQSRVKKLESERLKKVSEAIYQEANPPVDRHRPLEWHRDFNPVWLPLKNIKVVSNFNVHDRPFDLSKLFEPKQDNSPWQRIRSEINTQRFIKAIVDQEKFRDTILCTVTDDDDKEITRLAKPSGEIQVTLRTGTPFEGNDQVPSGIYGGECFRISDKEIGEDYLSFELYLPESHMNDILERLSGDHKVQIQVGVHLLSFSYEVDDTLGHWSQPRYLFIEKPAVALVITVNTSSLIDAKLSRDDDENGAEVSLPQSPVDLSPVIKALGRLTVAMWVLVAIIGYFLIK